MSSPLDPNDNYFGIELDNALWEDVSRCCIFPPDAAFLDDSEHPCYDADDNPIPTPKGEDGHGITILWRMDEPEDKRQERPRLHAILAAFAHLYRRCVSRRSRLRLLLVRYGEKAPFSSDLPAVNFRLWQTSFTFVECSFLLEIVSGTEFDQALPVVLPPCEAAVHEAAALAWCRLVYEQLEFLLLTITDARSYAALQATLEEWHSYSCQLTACEPEQQEYYGEVDERVRCLRLCRRSEHA